MIIQGQTAIVTGGARGIGKAIGVALAEAGAYVFVCDRDAEAARATAAEIGSDRACSLVCDIGQEASVIAALAEAVALRGGVDILVNNAGTSVVKPALDLTLAEWETTLRINLTGAFLFSRETAKNMRQRGCGRIVNITSISGQRGGIGRAAYGASKAGLTSLTQVMAVELAAFGITVNAVAPGPVMTDLAAATHSDATIEAYRRLVPMRRYGTTEEVASAVLFLASPQASYITGHTINVDGGFAAAGLMDAREART